LAERDDVPVSGARTLSIKAYLGLGPREVVAAVVDPVVLLLDAPVPGAQCVAARLASHPISVARKTPDDDRQLAAWRGRRSLQGLHVPFARRDDLAVF
jgi:hypothetical protein